MKHYMAGVFVLAAGMLVSCGGDEGDGKSGGSGGGAVAVAGTRVEETAATVSGTWAQANSAWGWSGGSAIQSSTAGATVSISFSGTSIRWLGSRGRAMGIATVSIDGGPAKEVDLFARPADEAHSDIIVINDLSAGTHTLTITVTGRANTQSQGNMVVVDAFDIQPTTTISHLQDTDPNAAFSAGWTKSDEQFPWSGSGVSNFPELPVTAQETTTAGATVTLSFRGTAISWVGYTGPDGGIATVQIDGGAPTQVDTYSPTAKYQPVVFTSGGLSDANHTLTITATGQKNAASSSSRIVVDAFDVINPGRRYEESDPAVSRTGSWDNRDSRVWSEGHALASPFTGDTVTFTFNGTSVAWIGCRKGSASGTGRVTLDGVVQGDIYLGETYPIEGYQMTVWRKEGLAPGPHTLTIEVVNTNGNYVVVDAFDVR